MLTLVIWFAALVTVIGSSNVDESSSAQALELTKLLRLVQQLRLNNLSKQRTVQLRADSSDSDTSSDTSDSNSDLHSAPSNRIATKKQKNRLYNLLHNASNRKGKMNSDGKLVRPGDVNNARSAKERIIGLIETVSANDKKKNDRITNLKGKLNHGRNSYLVRSENYDSSNNNIQKQILEKLPFSQTSNFEERQLKPKKRLKPNRLTPTLTMDDVNKYYGNKNKNVEVTGLEDYSKVYIVLNPQAVRNSKNKSELNDLISKVLSLSSRTSKRESQQVDPFRYKGFVVKQSHTKRSLKEINDNVARTGDHEQKLDLPAAPLDRITAIPK